MEKKNNANVKKIVIAVVAVILIVGAVVLAKFFIDKNDGNAVVNDTTMGQETIETTEPEPKPDYSEYVAKNPETVGWITIPGTNINAPVLQTVDNEYYMDHNFEQKSEYRGAIFMDYRNDAINLDANTIIYGHNSYDGKVFSDLAQYDDIEFYKEHPVIEFNTLDKYYQWKIYAVIITNQVATEDNGYIFNFIYPHMEGPNFKGYIGELNKRTLYYTGVDIKDGDRILTLSSCCRNLDLSNYRAKTSIVVIARAVRPGEDPTVDTSKAYINENPKYPQLYYQKHGIANPYKDDERWYPVEVKK
jgi:SrtB family sortase